MLVWFFHPRKAVFFWGWLGDSGWLGPRQDDKRLSKQAIWSLDFEVRLGFCNSRAHIVMAAFRAIASRDEASAYARKRRESS